MQRRNVLSERKCNASEKGEWYGPKRSDCKWGIGQDPRRCGALLRKKEKCIECLHVLHLEAAANEHEHSLEIKKKLHPLSCTLEQTANISGQCVTLYTRELREGIRDYPEYCNRRYLRDI